MIRNNVVTSEPDKGLLLNNYSCESDDNVVYRKKTGRVVPGFRIHAVDNIVQ